MLHEESCSDAMEVNMPDFPATAFQAFLTTEGILFGFFGFLFPIYVALI